MMKTQILRKTIITAALTIVAARMMYADGVKVFSNGDFKAGINLDNAKVVSLTNTRTGWEVISSPEYGCSFEANIKLSDGRFFVINGDDQDKPSVTGTNDGAIFVWDHLNAGGQRLDIKFTGTVKMTDDGIYFGGRIDNNSSATVEQLSWPFIGDVSVPSGTSRLLFQYMNYTKFNTEELWPREAGKGWSNFPEHSFTLVHNTVEGLYLSSIDHEFDEYIRCEYETIPKEGYQTMAGRADGKAGNAERNLMRTRIRAARMIYLEPGCNRELMNFQITTYKGDWHAGADIYKKWRKTWFNQVPRAEWLKHVNSWQQIQIQSSASRMNFKFTNLKKYVDDCVKWGVDAIQLTGWNTGGQDRGLPNFDPDPRCGTWDELKEGISYANKKGVKILLFTKYPWVDLTAGFHEEYMDHLCLNVAKDTCIHPGYNYYTYTQLEGLNTRRFGIFCNMDPSLRDKIYVQFKKNLDLGAPGMVFDENQHHAGAMLCFDKNHGHETPGFNYKGALLLAKGFYDMYSKVNPDFLMTGEGCYDIQSQYYATYTRADYWHEPVLRYLDSDVPIACAVIDHYDLNHINMCAAMKYAVSYEVRNFKGALDEFPRVMEYGRKVDALRSRYEDYVWNADYSDTIGASVKGENVRYGVFTSRKNGKKAVVIYNVNTTDARTATVKIDGVQGKLVYATPDIQKAAAFGGKITLNPQGMAIIMEK